MGFDKINKLAKEQSQKRIDTYNMNPNHCLHCGKPILATYDKRLNDIKRKKFCNNSCASSYNNVGRIHNKNGTSGQRNSVINKVSDDEIIKIFNNSNNLTEFSKKLGYKEKIHANNQTVRNRLDLLGLNLDDIIQKQISILDLTKGELFKRTANWQSARSQIQRSARQIYNDSDKTKECIICKYSKHYEVAHIKAVSDFDDNALISEINDVDNLIALCPNHHWEYDNTDFNIQNYL